MKAIQRNPNPILVAVMAYERSDLLTSLLFSLSSARGAEACHVIVSIDGGAIGDETASKLRKILEENSPFNFLRLDIRLRSVNHGREAHFELLRREIFERAPFFITLEEDNVVSRDFFFYFEQVLPLAQQDKSVFSISGYMYDPVMPTVPLPTSPVGLVASPTFAGYGVARFWDRDISALSATSGWATWLLRNPFRFLGLRKVGGNLFSHLVKMELFDETYGDVALSFYCFKNRLYNIFPTQTRVVNRGYDGRGENCGNDPRFQLQPLPEISQLYQLDTSHAPVIELRPLPDSVKKELFFIFLYFLLLFGLKSLAKKIYLGALNLKKLFLA